MGLVIALFEAMAKKKNSNVVCLSDETLNDYGFIVLTAGIQLDRFLKAPRLLAEHKNCIEYVLGKVINLHVEENRLMGELEFDVEDEDVAKIAGKWERGYLDSVSIGFRFNIEDVILNPDGTFVIMKCELYELSIVAIGSNKNAVRLYSNKDEKWLEGDELKATLSSCLNMHVEKPEINTMAKITLSALAVATHLGLKSQDVEQPELEAKIVDLHTAKLSAEAEAKKYKEQIEEFKTTELNAKKTKADNFVNKLITEGKLKASDTVEVERFRKLATDDFEFAESLASKLQGKSNLGSKVDNKTSVSTEIDEKETFDYLQKNNPKKLASIKETDPELYARLASDYLENSRYRKS